MRVCLGVILCVMKYAVLILATAMCLLSVQANAQRGKNWRLFGGKGTETEAASEPDTIEMAQPVDTVESAIAADSVQLPDTSKAGVIEVLQDYRIRELLNKQIAINDSTGTIPGYRVQIWFGSGAGSGSRAKEVEADFLSKYPDIATYRQYKAAAFRLKVGNFRTRMHALKFLGEVREHFPSSFVVEDAIELPPLD